MKELKVVGKREFLGMEVPIINGGFGEDKKCVLASTIAEIHNISLKRVNELINNNIDEFIVNADIVDLKNSVGGDDPLYGLGFSKQQIANSKNIYLFSEMGYVALTGLMKTDKAKEIRKQFRLNYFEIKDQLQKVAESNGELATSSNKLLEKIDNQIIELKEFYRTTHRNKLAINKYIKDCLGVNQTKENVNRVKDIVLTLLGNYKTYEEVPRDVLHNAETNKKILEVCQMISYQDKAEQLSF